MKKYTGYFFFQRLFMLILLLTASLGWLPVVAQIVPLENSNGIDVGLPNGYVTVSEEDMRLMTIAGEIRWIRMWNGQEWKFQPQWESLSQSWKNLTGSQSADTTTGAVSSGAGASSNGGSNRGCWVWVDEDWQPSVGSTLIGGIPEAAPMLAVRTTPFNRLMGEVREDYPPVQRVSVDYARLCVGSSISGSSFRDTEGVRRINQLYLGEKGRYAFNNRSILEKRAVQQIPPASTSNLYSQLTTGRVVFNPETNPKGFRLIDRGGDWIDYNTQGQVVAYGDRNNNTIWMLRDTGGILRGVLDANGRVLWSLHYTGDLLTEIRDYPAQDVASDLPSLSVQYQYDGKNRLIQVTDVRGNITRYDYDAGNRLTKVTDAEGRIELFTYNGETVKQRIAPDGGVTDYVFDYDDTNKQFISKIIGPETAIGRRVDDFTHNRVGKLVRHIVNGHINEEIRYDLGARAEIITNARGFVTRNTHNEFDLLVEVAHPDSSTYKRAYSTLHLEITEETDELGVRTQYHYDVRGNLLKKIEASGTLDERITEYTRNALGQLTQVTRKGRTEVNGTVTSDSTWRISYDQQGQINQTIDPEGHIRRYLYNRAGKLLTYIDPLGNATRYEVDAQGNLLKETNPLGHTRRYTYDKAGNLISETDAKGKATLKVYDAMNRLLQSTSPTGGVLKVQYNAQGLPVTEIDEDGRRNQIEYDNFERIVKQFDTLGNTVKFSYLMNDGSAAGQLGSLGDPAQVDYPGFSQINRFDSRERLTMQSLKYSNAQGEQVSTNAAIYDKRGQVLSEIGADGNTRTHRYNALGMRIETTDSLGSSTRYNFDVAGNLLEMIDALGNTYKFEYDRNDRLLKEILPLGQVTQYQYDPAGNLAKKTDPAGNQQIYSRDAAQRITRIDYRQADGTLLRTTAQTWDANGYLTTWSDTDHSRNHSSSASLNYDDAGRKISETLTYPSGYTLGYQYSYSPSGKKIRLTWPDGTQIDYGYSAHGELETVTIPGEGTINIQEFAWNTPKKIIYPGGGVQSRSFDGLLNLENLDVKTPTQHTTLTLSNRFGKLQEIRSRSRTDASNNQSTTRNEQYSLDADSRLTQVQIDTGGLFGTDTEYFTLDAVGNRTAYSKVSGAWTYDANNRLTQIGTGNCGQKNVICYQWDALGNLTQKQTFIQITRYRYDNQNRLAEVHTDSGQIIVRYGYDPSDRRLWKEQYRDQKGLLLTQAVRTYYLYADEGLIAEATQPITLNDDGSTTADAVPQIVAQYGPNPDSQFTTGILFIKTRNSNAQDTVAYYHHDHLDTPIQATDKTGNVVWSANYAAFGRATIITPQATADKPTVISNLRLPGQYEDSETGFHYNFRRYYDPETGRYITSDPIGLDGGINVFVYANANPVLYMDPRGEVAPAIVWGARVAAAALAAALKKCAKNPVCRCRALYAAYKAPCGIPCSGGSCAYLKFAAAAAEMCYRGRHWYIAAGCDKHIPTTKDHPGTRDQAASAYSNCVRRRDAACNSCSL